MRGALRGASHSDCAGPQPHRRLLSGSRVRGSSPPPSRQELAGCPHTGTQLRSQRTGGGQSKPVSAGEPSTAKVRHPEPLAPGGSRQDGKVHERGRLPDPEAVRQSPWVTRANRAPADPHLVATNPGESVRDSDQDTTVGPRRQLNSRAVLIKSLCPAEELSRCELSVQIDSSATPRAADEASPVARGVHCCGAPTLMSGELVLAY